jgi:hypothetical protein
MNVDWWLIVIPQFSTTGNGSISFRENKLVKSSSWCKSSFLIAPNLKFVYGFITTKCSWWRFCCYTTVSNTYNPLTVFVQIVCESFDGRHDCMNTRSTSRENYYSLLQSSESALVHVNFVCVWGGGVKMALVKVFLQPIPEVLFAHQQAFCHSTFLKYFMINSLNKKIPSCDKFLTFSYIWGCKIPTTFQRQDMSDPWDSH